MNVTNRTMDVTNRDTRLTESAKPHDVKTQSHFSPAVLSSPLLRPARSACTPQGFAVSLHADANKAIRSWRQTHEELRYCTTAVVHSTNSRRNGWRKYHSPPCDSVTWIKPTLLRLRLIDPCSFLEQGEPRSLLGGKKKMPRERKNPSDISRVSTSKS